MGPGHLSQAGFPEKTGIVIAPNGEYAFAYDWLTPDEGAMEAYGSDDRLRRVSPGEWVQNQGASYNPFKPGFASPGLEPLESVVAQPGEPWVKGTWGKGFLVGKKPVVWQTTPPGHGMRPSHLDVEADRTGVVHTLPELTGRRTNKGGAAQHIVIAPDGAYARNGFAWEPPETDPRYKAFEKANPDLHQVGESEWGMASPGLEPPGGERHKFLLRDAVSSWVGYPTDMDIHMARVREGRAERDDEGPAGRMDEMAEALLWELEHKSRPNDKTLYRGQPGEIKEGTWRSWSERRAVAGQFARKGGNGRDVHVLRPGEAEGIRVADYVFSSHEENEWIARPRLAAMPSPPLPTSPSSERWGMGSPGDPWKPGVWGKGLMDSDGQPVIWETSSPLDGMRPVHLAMAGELGHSPEGWNAGWTPIVIAPDGSYTTSSWGRREAQGEEAHEALRERALRYAELNPNLRFVSEGDWAAQQSRSAGLLQNPAMRSPGKPVPKGAKFHVTERFGEFWLAMSYPHQELLSGAANRRIRKFDTREEAEAVAAEMNQRVGMLSPAMAPTVERLERPAVPFSHPNFRPFDPNREPQAQVESGAEAKAILEADPWVDEVTTELPKEGGIAVMVAWRKEGGERIPVGYLFITPEGQRIRHQGVLPEFPDTEVIASGPPTMLSPGSVDTRRFPNPRRAEYRALARRESRWTPGNTGKGYVSPNGSVRTWNTDPNMDGHPFHNEVMESDGLERGTDAPMFAIEPDGRVFLRMGFTGFAPFDKRKVERYGTPQQVMDKIVASNPEFKPGPIPEMPEQHEGPEWDAWFAAVQRDEARRALSPERRRELGVEPAQAMASPGRLPPVEASRVAVFKARHAQLGQPWQPGYWGKGYMVEGKPVVWQTQAPGGGMAPHHGIRAKEEGLPDRGLTATHEIVVTPDGYFALSNRRGERELKGAENWSPEQWAEYIDGLRPYEDMGLVHLGEKEWGERQKEWKKAEQKGVAEGMASPGASGALYHLAPRSKRDEIRREGLKVSAPVESGYWGAEPDVMYQREGVYFFDSKESVESWAAEKRSRYRTPLDVWQVAHPHPASLRQDTMIAKGSWYDVKDVPPERLTLLGPVEQPMPGAPGGFVYRVPGGGMASPGNKSQRFLNSPPPGPRFTTLDERNVTPRGSPPWQQTYEEFAADPQTWWHGTPYGFVGGGKNPAVHLGNWATAHEALRARAAGQHTDQDVPEVVPAQTGFNISMDPANPFITETRPAMIPLRIVGPMGAGRRHDFVGDRRAGEGPSVQGMLSAMRKRGLTPHQGYYYRNEGEGVEVRQGGRVLPHYEKGAQLVYADSAVVPDASWLKTHEEYVREAVRRGKPVPDHVRDEYGLGRPAMASPASTFRRLLLIPPPERTLVREAHVGDTISDPEEGHVVITGRDAESLSGRGKGTRREVRVPHSSKPMWRGGIYAPQGGMKSPAKGEPGEDWVPGTWGKGYLVPDYWGNRSPVVWQTTHPSEGMAPDHGEMEEKSQMWAAGIDADHQIVVAPDGSYAPSDWWFRRMDFADAPDEAEAWYDEYRNFDAPGMTFLSEDEWGQRQQGAFNAEYREAAETAAGMASPGFHFTDLPWIGKQYEQHKLAQTHLNMLEKPPAPVIGIPNYTVKHLKDVKSAGGTTGARMMKDKDGNGWLVKTYRGDRDRVATELLANAIYRELGVPVANAGSVEVTMPVTKWDYKKKRYKKIGEETQTGLTYPLIEGDVRRWDDENEELGEGYVADALLANWDVIGLAQDNILWSGDTPIRVDQGGTLFYRAQGDEKTFGPVPTEMWTLMSPAGGQAYGRMRITEDGLRQQAADAALRLTPERIDQLVSEAPFESEELRDKVREALKARVAWLDRFSRGEENLPKPTSDADTVEVFIERDAALLTEPEEDQALQDYIDRPDAIDLHLRSKKPKKAASEAVQDAVSTLDALLEDQVTRTPQDTYAYMPVDFGQLGEDDIERLRDRWFIERSYMQPNAFPPDQNIYMRILVPANSNVLMPSALDGVEDPEGGRLLMPRESKLKITGQEIDSEGHIIIEAIVETGEHYASSSFDFLSEGAVTSRQIEAAAGSLSEAGFNPSQQRDALGKWSRQGGGKRKRGVAKVGKARKLTDCKLDLKKAKPADMHGAEWEAWKRMTPEEKQARAEQVYAESWGETAGLFGAEGQPPPTVVWPGQEPFPEVNIPNPAAAVGNRDGYRAVYLTPRMAEVLSYPPKTRSGRAEITQAKLILLHEYAHVYQDQTLWEDENLNLREEAAQLFATYWAHRLWGTPELGHIGHPPYANRDEIIAELGSRFGAGYWEGSQFTDYRGRDPRTIRWHRRTLAE